MWHLYWQHSFRSQRPKQTKCIQTLFSLCISLSLSLSFCLFLTLFIFLSLSLSVSLTFRWIHRGCRVGWNVPCQGQSAAWGEGTASAPACFSLTFLCIKNGERGKKHIIWPHFIQPSLHSSATERQKNELFSIISNHFQFILGVDSLIRCSWVSFTLQICDEWRCVHKQNLQEQDIKKLGFGY